ncbi:MAG: hypothetical protein HUJ25_12585 [Crocinitomicaceae bacterium]|nr:hypothetical protein [Crocinitomicaceae bacterium]
MNATDGILIVLSGGLAIGLFTGLIVRKSGYSFGRYFVTGFLMGAGILGIILKILMDYL